MPGATGSYSVTARAAGGPHHTRRRSDRQINSKDTRGVSRNTSQAAPATVTPSSQSYESPTDPMDASMPARIKRVVSLMDVYWQPWSA